MTQFNKANFVQKTSGAEASLSYAQTLNLCFGYFKGYLLV